MSKERKFCHFVCVKTGEAKRIVLVWATPEEAEEKACEKVGGGVVIHSELVSPAKCGPMAEILHLGEMKPDPSSPPYAQAEIEAANHHLPEGAAMVL